MNSPDENKSTIALRRRASALRRATLLCPLVSVALGLGAARLREYAPRNEVATALGQLPTVAAPAPARDEKVSAATGETPRADVIRRPEEVFVPGGLVLLSADGHPPRKVFVEPFWIGETEVTNRQYAEFVRATSHPAPVARIAGGDHYGAAEENDDELPVANVSWQDAANYCRWLSEKIGAEVRLPTEAEWTLAAGGPERWRYPWGDHWDARAVAAKEGGTAGPRAVKSNSLNRSPYGAYDMAGNVWEWVADEDGSAKDDARGGDVAGVVRQRASLKTIKGGANDETPDLMRIDFGAAVAAESRDDLLGFRYVVVRRTPPTPAHSPR